MQRLRLVAVHGTQFDGSQNTVVCQCQGIATQELSAKLAGRTVNKIIQQDVSSGYQIQVTAKSAMYPGLGRNNTV